MDFIWVAYGSKEIAYGRIALTLELLGRFGRFLDEDDRHSPPVLLLPFSRLLGL